MMEATNNDAINAAVRMRVVRVVCACLVMIAIGFIYGWSIFSAPLKAEFQWDATALSFTFTVLMWMFVAGGIIGARISEVTSVRVTLIVGAACIFLSFFLTTLLASAETPWIMYLTYGVLGGGGVGMCYTVTLSAGVSWFPDRTGAVTGVMLLCYSFSTMVLSSVAAWLFATVGWRAAFVGLSAVMAIIVAAMSFIVRRPTEAEMAALPRAQKKDDDGKQQAQQATRDYKTGEMLKTPAFWTYIVWMFLMSCIGLGLIGSNNNVALETGMGTVLAVTAVGVFSVCNGLGRLFNGFIYDILGTTKMMGLVAALHTAGCLIIIAALVTQSTPILFAGFIIGALGIGGVSIVGSGFMATAFGSKYYAKNLSMLNVTLVPAAFCGPLIMSSSVSATQSYYIGIIVLVAAGIVGFLCMFATRAAMKKL